MKLRKSGYKTRQRLEIMISGLRGYQNMCDVEDTGGRKINRTRKEGAKARRVRKVIGKSNWYKEKKRYVVDEEVRQFREKQVERGSKPKET